MKPLTARELYLMQRLNLSLDDVMNHRKSEKEYYDNKQRKAKLEKRRETIKSILSS